MIKGNSYFTKTLGRSQIAVGLFDYFINSQVTNPFDFMETISLEGKTNFFEKKVQSFFVLFFVFVIVFVFVLMSFLAKQEAKLSYIFLGCGICKDGCYGKQGRCKVLP